MPSFNFSDAWPWLQWLLAAAAVVAFVGGAVRVIPAVWKFVRRFVDTVDSLADLPEELEKQSTFRDETEVTLEKQNKQLALLKHEVLPNGGGSLRDAVDKHGVALAEVKEQLASDDVRITKLQARDEQGRFVKKDDVEP